MSREKQISFGHNYAHVSRAAVRRYNAAIWRAERVITNIWGRHIRSTNDAYVLLRI